MSPSCQSEAGVLKRVVLKHVRDAFVDESVIDAEWEALGYLHRPDFALALKEYDAFVDLLQGFGIESLFLPRSDGVGLDSIYAPSSSSSLTRKWSRTCELPSKLNV